MNFWTFLDRNIDGIFVTILLTAPFFALGAFSCHEHPSKTSGCGISIEIKSKDGGAP